MNEIHIYPQNLMSYTLIPNHFIDQHLANSNGDFVKIYLLLLRHVSSGAFTFSPVAIADQLFLTESDVMRALKFWESKGVFDIDFNEKVISAIHFKNFNETPPQLNVTPDKQTAEVSLDNPSPAHNTTTAPTPSTQKETVQATSVVEPLLRMQSKPQYSIDELSDFVSQADFKQLVYMTQKYLGKMLSQNDINTLISFNDWLGLPIEVIEVLIEYCVSNDHRNMNYIEKVAIDWSENGIKTQEQAQYRTQVYNKHYFSILKAFGLGDRTPTPPQIKFMDRWLKEFGFDMDIIEEACHRTVAAISKPEFKYADKMLHAWFEAQVHTLADITKLDADFQEKAEKKKAEKLPYRSMTTPPPSKNKFTNYNQRTYDFDELEKKALELRLKESNDKRYLP